MTDNDDASYEYQFLYKGPDTDDMWTLLRDYAPSSSTQWSTVGGVGRYRLQVRVRLIGAPPAAEVSDRLSYWLNAPDAATGVQLEPDLTSPQQIGQIVELSARGQGGTGQYEYRFSIKGPGTTDRWDVVQQFDPQNTYAWDTAAFPGSNQISLRQA